MDLVNVIRDQCAKDGFAASKDELILCTLRESSDKKILRDVQTDMYYFENAVGRRIQKGL